MVQRKLSLSECLEQLFTIAKVQFSIRSIGLERQSIENWLNTPSMSNADVLEQACWVLFLTGPNGPSCAQH